MGGLLHLVERGGDWAGLHIIFFIILLPSTSASIDTALNVYFQIVNEAGGLILSDCRRNRLSDEQMLVTKLNSDLMQ